MQYSKQFRKKEAIPEKIKLVLFKPSVHYTLAGGFFRQCGKR